MQHHRVGDPWFFDDGDFDRRRFWGREERDRDQERFRWNGRWNLTRSQLRDEFYEEFYEFTDEKRNEWLKWIDERSKQYSIEPLTIKKLSKDSNGDSNLDTVVYQTSYGTLEVQEQFVENFVTKPVDSIMKSRGKRDPLVIGQPETSFNLVIPSTDPPNRYEYYPTYDLMDLYMNQKRDYTKFCEDLYENYQDMGRGYYERINAKWDFISFDELSDELCLKIQHVSEHSGQSNLKTPGK